ncbi:MULTISPECIES: DUF4190 domain-containing protein [Streptomyces]|uniref:DUF4190 domain-containing protein n=1 Tax=Streptomyces TaxID=1883 RepID=UPI0020C81052|nr:DUF4190 domain-containing protein [Streptomyces qinglanensis]
MALVLGVLAALSFWTVIGGIALGILALVLGVLGFRRASRGRATNKGVALTGSILGALAIVGSSILLAAGLTVFNSDEFDNYQDCRDHASSDSAREKCAEDFGDELEK